MNMREEFEKWLSNCLGSFVDMSRDEYGVYQLQDVRLAWMAWQAAQPKWIKCSEQMPPENVLVTVADADYGQLYACAVASLCNGTFYPGSGLTASNYDGGAIVDIDMDVTHWMPLPNPPEE